MQTRIFPHKKYTLAILQQWRETVVDGLDRETLPAQAQFGKCLIQSSDFRKLAMIDYYLGAPVDEVRQLLGRSAQFDHQRLILVQTGQVSAREGAYPTINTWGVATALVAGRKPLAVSMAERQVQLDEAGMLKPVMIYWDAFRWMFVYLTLERDNDAKVWADKIINHKRKDQRKFFLPLAHVTNALVARDETLVKTTLEEYLVAFDGLAKRGSHRDTAEGMMSFEGMACVIFARARGMDIRVDNPYLFYDLLE